jgi:hypothetical protein
VSEAVIDDQIGVVAFVRRQIKVNVAPYLATLLDFHDESRNACSAAMVSSLKLYSAEVRVWRCRYPTQNLSQRVHGEQYYLQQLLVSWMFSPVNSTVSGSTFSCTHTVVNV